MIKVGIVGGTGYTGVELLRLLAVHPEAHVEVITSRSEEGVRVCDMYPNLRGHYDELRFSIPDTQKLGACDVVFFATPHGVAHSMAAELLATGTRIIDLSADFRLRDADEWGRWYGQPHGAPELLTEAVYGLPEVNREAIRNARLIAVPGCYPTATQLGFLPLLEAGIVDASRLIADCKSGVSGAGRGASVGSLLGEASESLKAYSVKGHRHLPEISHGQTIRHHPEQGFSVQIGAPALLAELTGIDVITDFRSTDVAAGGEGAPLVPAFHHWLLADPVLQRVLVNIGGFANLTLLHPGKPVTGFDSGPGNVLLDEWVQTHLDQPYDAGGEWAHQGKVIDNLLSAMLADPYFSRTAPKSTGREYFNGEWLGKQLSQLPEHPLPADVQATLLELTAISIANAVKATAQGCDDLYICGGGTRNTHLMNRIQALLSPLPVCSTERIGVDPDWMEAMAFAWLAWRRLTRQQGNLPAVTGAGGERVLGALYCGPRSD